MRVKFIVMNTEKVRNKVKKNKIQLLKLNVKNL